MLSYHCTHKHAINLGDTNLCIWKQSWWSRELLPLHEVWYVYITIYIWYTTILAFFYSLFPWPVVMAFFWFWQEKCFLEITYFCKKLVIFMCLFHELKEMNNHTWYIINLVLLLFSYVSVCYSSTTFSSSFKPVCP